MGDKRPTDMARDTNASSSTPSTAIGELPEYPGSGFLAHNAATWLENATAKLGDLKLLAVANGRDHPTAACIVDVDLTTLPELPPPQCHFNYEI